MENSYSHGDFLKMVDDVEKNDLQGIFGLFSDVASCRYGMNNDEKHRINEMLMEKLSQTTATFVEWKSCFDRCGYYSNGKALKKLVAGKMAEAAETFQHWNILNNMYVSAADFLERSLEMMFTLANSIKEFLIVFKRVPEGSELQKKSAEKVRGSVETFKDCLYVCRQAPKGTFLYEEALLLLEKWNAPLNVLWKTYKNSCAGTDIRKLVVKKFCEVEAPFDQWCELYVASHKKCSIRRVALKRMKEKISSVEL